MAINVNFNGASLFEPGAYSRLQVNLSGGFPLAPTGIVAIVGEADGGAPGSSDGVQTFTSQDIANLAAKYKSGPIVDAARILVAPARDARVPNGAGLIRVYKTNASTAATLALANAAPVTLFNITSRNFGSDENLISLIVAAGTNPLARVITVQKGSQKEILSENEYAALLVITYTGSATVNTLTIQSGVLATVTSSASIPADDLSIPLAGKTIQQLVDIIDAHPSYTCTTTYTKAASKSAADLDPISTPTSVLSALTLRGQQKELLDIINGQSALVSAARVNNVEGTIATFAAKKFLAGGAKGASANTSFQSGFDALLAFRCNMVVPLISQDASALITLGATDPASTFTVDAVNLQAVTHCITASNTKNRSERNAYVSVKRSFANSQAAALAINSERASMLFQDVQVLGADGNLVFQDPWAGACMLAGIQAGTDVGTPATFKKINANALKHQDYNEKTQKELAIQAGLLPLASVDSGGFRVVVHNSTYSTDANFVFNRPSVLYAADTVAYNLRQQLEAIFVGEKARTGSAQAIYNTVVAIMSLFLNAELIVGDDTNNNLGWKDMTVNISGNTATVNITITPVQGIDFVLNNITLDNIRQSA